MSKKTKSFMRQTRDTDMPTKFYRTGMAMAVGVIMSFGAWYFNRLTSSVDTIADRVSGVERKQDRLEFIATEFGRKFEELQREIRKIPAK